MGARGQWASGVLLLALGLWLLLRTVVHGADGKNLVDKVLSL